MQGDSWKQVRRSEGGQGHKKASGKLPPQPATEVMGEQGLQEARVLNEKVGYTFKRCKKEQKN